MRFTSTPALPAAIDKEVWNARDAGTMMSNLSTFYRSIYGQGQEGMRRDLLRDNGVDPDDLVDLQIPGENALAIARVFEDHRTTTILAQDDFAQMLRAAALTAPTAELHRDELISPNGMLFFARPQDLSDLIKYRRLPIRAISWWTVETLNGTSIQIRIYVDGPELWRMLLAEATPNPGVPVNDEEPCVGSEEMHRFVFPIETLDTTIERNSELPTTDTFLRVLGLVRSILAVSKSAHTRDTKTDTESDKQRKIRRRKGLPETRQVRVLSLVNPDYGRYEMDAATGRKLRSHWVRGHWRQQWYASLQDHRTIWIDGFVRGDATLGSVPGRKIYVARGTSPAAEPAENISAVPIPVPVP